MSVEAAVVDSVSAYQVKGAAIRDGVGAESFAAVAPVKTDGKDTHCCADRGSNPAPLAYRASALTIELRRVRP